MKSLNLRKMAAIFVSCWMGMSLQGEASASMLEFVPEDTVIFAGGLEPLPTRALLEWNMKYFGLPQDLDLAAMMHEDLEIEPESPEGLRMVMQIWQESFALMTAPDVAAELENWGYGEQGRFVFYTVGLAPVYRSELKDPAKFKQKIAKMQSNAKIKPITKTLGTAKYRRYPLATESGPALIVGVDGSDAIFAVDLGVDSEETLALALGQKKPAKSLNPERLQALQKKYQLAPSVLGYLDHRRLIAGLTHQDSTRMVKMLQAFAEQSKELTGALAELQSAGCRDELAQIGKTWPQSVFGYTEFDLETQPSRMGSLMVLENTDEELLEELQSLRGFVPDYEKAQPGIISLAVGLNLEKFIPFLTRMHDRISQQEYQCSVLKQFQQGMQGGLMPLTMMASMAPPGLRGAAVSLFSLELEQPPVPGAPPQPKNLDALVTLSAQEPAKLLQAFAGMMPALAEFKLPADGTPVEVPLPPEPPLPVTPLAAVNGPHLSLYAGEKAADIAKTLGKAALDSSPGIMSMEMDYGRYYSLITQAIGQEMEQEDPQARKMIEAMAKTKLRLLMTLDFTSQGIVMKTDMLATE